jgi:hypothetical protein
VADNIAVTPGSGDTIAADDVGGAKWQRVKLGIGADGTANDLASPSDSQTPASLIPTGLMLLNGAATAWNRAREADAAGDGSSGLGMPMAQPRLWNGATFDRQRGNTSGVLLASAARTTTTNSATQTNYNARGVIVSVDVTAAGTGTLTLSLYNTTSDTGNWINMGPTTGYALPATIAYYAFIWYPGTTVFSTIAAGAVSGGISVPLPRYWLANLTKSDGSSWTYHVEYDLIV